ncbi:MAG TPA: hypothetical protein VGP96_06325 [Candidatus Dormibacteraeota bacterium]|nr:hypothetical protein [Candidatus Dormibacteraeota bacterium]
MRLKLDENLGIRTAHLFAEAGHDVATRRDHPRSGLRQPAPVRSSEHRRHRGPPGARPPGRSDLEVAAGVLIGAPAEVDIAGQRWVVDRHRVRRYEPGTEAED